MNELLPQWISMKDALPDQYVPIIAAIQISTGTWLEKVFVSADGVWRHYSNASPLLKSYRITHWMPPFIRKERKS